MDPITLVIALGSIAKGVGVISTEIYTFIQDARKVDQSVTDVLTEVKSLQRVTEAVKASLESPSLVAASNPGNRESITRLWRDVKGCLDDCQMTVSRLEVALQSVKKPGSNFFMQAVRTVKFNMKVEDVQDLRSQIRGHVMAFQLVLQTINVYVKAEIQ